MKETVYLIDGSAYIYRAFYALAPLTTKAGMPTQAVFGFISIVRRLLREKEPRYLAVAFDSRGKVFRHDMYAQYKANRPTMPEDLACQIPHIHEYVEAENILCLAQEGVEADDLLASAAFFLRQVGHEVVIISGDKDLLQLVGDGLTVWEPMKNTVYDAQAVADKYQAPPEKLLDLFALMGDSSDNVPGVPGIGPKTAAKLISDYGSLDGIYQAIGTMKASKNKERLAENREQAFLSRQLIRLKTDALAPRDLAAYARRDEDAARLAALFTKLEFYSLLAEMPTNGAASTAKPVDTAKFTLVQSEAQLQAMVDALSGEKAIAIDTETDSLEARSARLVGLSFATEDGRAWYLPVGHKDENGALLPGQIKEDKVRQALAPLLSSGLVKIGHNLKFDYTILAARWQLPLAPPLFDTMIAAHLLEIGERSLKLDDLAEELGFRLTSFAEVTKDGARPDAFAHVALDAACDYSCEDVFAAWRLYLDYAPKLAERGIARLMDEVEMPLVPVLAAMEMRGIRVDAAHLRILAGEFQDKMRRLREEIYQLAGRELNIMSPKQLGEVLFEELKLPHGKKTKTGYSTDVSVLEKLASYHPLPGKILEYRTVAKLLATYVEKLAQLRNPATGRVHTSFNQAVTATGRLSSTNPNLQNIPIRGEDGNRIRRAFVPAPGMVFLSADYSQIDLRVLAHYSRDTALCQAFVRGEDIHSRTAIEVFGVAPLMVTGDMRRVAKSINFGIVYGMSSFGLANQLNIGRKEAQKFIDRYFQHYPDVERFMKEIAAQARRDGFVTTLFGRRRILPDINSKNKSLREFAERTAINTPIQGTAAEIIKVAMVKAEQDLAARRIDARLLLQIHDELVFELEERWLDAAQPLLKQVMEEAVPLAVPLTVNIVKGDSLAKG
ncbi:MAG: DNA polymerase I [Desulfobulbaceae bacterium]|jgi:DNA polymerase-1|nr:DNA polymerase I [Desulfobulbaceae bacterium]